MKSANCTGSNNAVVVVADTTSLSSFSSSSSSSQSSSSSLNVAGVASTTSALKGASSAAEEDSGLACWQQQRGGGGGGGGGLRDLHSSSDTDDCDLDLGVGRLVIDLEADPDARARCPVEMKSSGSQQTKSMGHSAGTLTGTHSAATSVGNNSTMEANPHLARGPKVTPSSENATKPSHKSAAKNVGSNNSFLPMTTALGDLSDKGIKMRIKCNQSGANSTSSGSTMKHEILPYHVPFIPSAPTSSENVSTATADTLSMSVTTKISNERSSYGSVSGSLSSRSNCGRSSSHKKERHSTKDRSRATSFGRPLGEDLMLASSARASPSSTSMNCSSAKDCVVDVAVKMDVASCDGDGAKALTSVHDPYEFNMKTEEEESVGLPVKKVKLEKVIVMVLPINQSINLIYCRPNESLQHKQCIKYIMIRSIGYNREAQKGPQSRSIGPPVYRTPIQESISSVFV